MKASTPNICGACLHAGGRRAPAWEIADTGVCGRCGHVGEVFDLELLHVYREGGLSDLMIWQAYPRLRMPHPEQAAVVTLDEARQLTRNWR